MTDKFKKQIQKARPSLKTVSPLAHWTMMVMAVFNLLLGAALFFSLDSIRFNESLLIVNNLLTFKFWGLVFFIIGLLKLYSLKTNNWELARHTLIVGVAIKATWAVALTIRAFVSPGTFFVDLIWVTLAALQMGAYIHFLPPQLVGYQDGKYNDK